MLLFVYEVVSDSIVEGARSKDSRFPPGVGYRTCQGESRKLVLLSASSASTNIALERRKESEPAKLSQ